MAFLDLSVIERTDSESLEMPSNDCTLQSALEKRNLRDFPTMLMKLLNETQDDNWDSVVQRIWTHPHEILIMGKSNGQNSLHSACMRYPPLEVIQEMLRVAPEAALQQNRDGETPLHLASYSASEEVQAMLLEAAPQAMLMQDRYGDTPLHFAARSGATNRLMEKFLRASPNSLMIRNACGFTPFWLLPRSYLEADSIEEILDDEGYDYKIDFDLMVLFLRASYPDGMNVPDEVFKIDRERGYPWLVHSAAATPACPREVIQFLGRVLPEQSLKYNKQGMTPLLLASKALVMEEPAQANDEMDEGQMSIFERLENESVQENEEVLDIILNWDKMAASYADACGRLPLAHAIISDKPLDGGVRELIKACPRALEVRDIPSRFYPFQLAAIHSSEIDTVYTVVRSLPELISIGSYEFKQIPPNFDFSDEYGQKRRCTRSDLD